MALLVTQIILGIVESMIAAGIIYGIVWLRRQVKRLGSEREQLMDLIQAAQRQRTQSEEYRNRFSATIQQADRELEALRKHLGSGVATLLDELKSMDAQIATSAGQISDLSQRFASLEANIIGLQTETRRLNDWIISLHITPDNETTQSMKHMTDVMERIDTLAAQVAVLKLEVKHLPGREGWIGFGSAKKQSPPQSTKSQPTVMDEVQRFMELPQHNAGEDGSPSNPPHTRSTGSSSSS